MNGKKIQTENKRRKKRTLRINEVSKKNFSSEMANWLVHCLVCCGPVWATGETIQNAVNLFINRKFAAIKELNELEPCFF